jgi:Domain of unknown function (DUF4268)
MSQENQDTIGKLVRVPLREVWKHEAYDFTQWLQENIDVLGNALGITLVNVSREQAAGSFSIDLVAEDESGGIVIIENQLEKSDHDHLGKLITYLTALNARTAIWLVPVPRPEHVAAMAWLNSTGSATFYMVKVEAVRIGNSPAALLLTQIVGPAEDAKDVAQTKKEFTETHAILKRWWTQLIARSAMVNKLHAHLGPSKGTWIAAGNITYRWRYNVTQNNCSADMYIDQGETEINRRVFNQLLEKREAIETEFGDSLIWFTVEGNRACRISFSVEGGFKSPEAEWEEIQDNVIGAMDRLEKALRPHLKTLKVTA